MRCGLQQFGESCFSKPVKQKLQNFEPKNFHFLFLILLSASALFSLELMKKEQKERMRK
jgi:hypothetical protein